MSPRPAPTGVRNAAEPAVDKAEPAKPLPFRKMSHLPLTDEELRAELPEHADAFAAANNDFAFALYSAAGDKSENFAFSPVSVELALGMTARGAAGKTREGMLEAMGVESWEAFEPSLAAIQALWKAAEAQSQPARWREGRKVELHLANRLYAQRGYPFDPDYFSWNEANFGARPELMDFETSADEAREQINAWTAKATAGYIEHLLPDGALDKRTRLVLVNALHFHGDWSVRFETYNTHDADFHVGDEVIQVPTMLGGGNLVHARVGDVEVVELPYEGKRFAMTIAMPTGKGGLEAFERGLDRKRWDELVAALQHENFRLWLPKFRVAADESLRLRPALSAMGMSEAFTARADFSAMVEGGERRDLMLDDVFHQSVIEVHEFGTKAAAATAVSVPAKSGIPGRELKVRIDRPFFFAIRDLATGSLLFVGRVQRPVG